MIQPIVMQKMRSLIDQCLTHNADIHAELRAVEQGMSLAGNGGYLPQHFVIEELVSKPILDRYGDQAWQFLDDRILWTADAIWEYFKPGPASIRHSVFVNNWMWGGFNDSRGFRAPDDQDGAYCSQHRMGRALDVSLLNLTAKHLFDTILENQSNPAFQHITTIKLYDWGVHIDCRNTTEEKIVVLPAFA